MNDVNIIRNAFERIYNDDVWVGGSGPGSTPSSTIEYRAFLERFIFENDIRSVSDLGCGDWQFSKLINWSKVSYTGYDIVPSLISVNNEKFGAENITFRLFDSIKSLPGGDLIICKEVLQHLPNYLVSEYLNYICHQYRFALITNSVPLGDGVNYDIGAGGFRPLRVEREPFFARGAVVFVYYPRSKLESWYNTVFLMIGDKK